jgi:hypothetical protein
MIGAHFDYAEAICWFYGTRPDEYGGDNDEDRAIATGGLKELEDLFAKFNIKVILRDVGSPEAEYVSNKLIVNPGDYKGLQFRGLAGLVSA